MKYRMKPIEVDAIRAGHAIDDARDNWASLPLWLVEAYNKGGVVFTHDAILMDITDGGGKRVVRRDAWIIRFENGELSAREHTAFMQTFEPVSDE